MKTPIIIKLPNLPATTTILALGFLLGNLLFLPMIAWLGQYIRPEFRDTVETIAGLFKDGMLLILGFYFAKVVNAGQQDMANRALDAAVASTPTQDVRVVNKAEDAVPVTEGEVR